MALPMSRYLASRGDQVTWVCGESVAPLVKTYSQAARVIVVDDMGLMKGSFFHRFWLFIKIWYSFLGQRYDLKLIGHRDVRYRYLVSLAMGKTRSFGDEIDGVKTPNGSRHHSFEYIKLATGKDGVVAVDPSLYLPDAHFQCKGKNRRIGLFPGGGRNLLADDPQRRWPLEDFRRLAQLLLERGYQVELHGSGSDGWVLSLFQDLNVENHIGRYDLVQLMDRMSSAAAVVTHDSGPLHLAGLVGVPVFGIFGPTRGHWRFPLKNKGRILELENPLPCQPCYDGKSFAHCQDNRCLKAISADKVAQAIDSVIES